MDEEQHGEEDTEQIRQMLKEENITMLEEDEVVCVCGSSKGWM